MVRNLLAQAQVTLFPETIFQNQICETGTYTLKNYINLQ